MSNKLTKREAERLIAALDDLCDDGRLQRLRDAAATAPPPVLGYARQFRIEVSLDGRAWQKVAEGPGAPLITAGFSPTPAKYVRITQTGGAAGAPPWVVQNLRIYKREAGK